MIKYQYLELIDLQSYCILALNRPDKRNALNKDMRLEVLDFFAQHAKKYKSIIITGKGPGFCAGKDLNEEDFESTAMEFMQVVESIFNCDAITIAAVNGAARGGGLMIINACDIAIASDSATFGMPDISKNGHSTFQDPKAQRLLIENAKSYLPLVGKSISPKQAQAIKVVNKVVKGDVLIHSSKDLCNRISLMNFENLFQVKSELNSVVFDNVLRSKLNLLVDQIMG